MSLEHINGLFWSGVPKKDNYRPMPVIPNTGWLPPTYYPNLSGAKVLSIDCETYDPDLIEYGPGWSRNKGHIVGVAIGADNDGRWYFPIRHEIEPEYNLDPQTTLNWLRETLQDTRQPKIGANIGYDVGWLKQENVDVRGELIDVQFAEALLTETSRVSLETLSQKYLLEGKESNALYEWCAAYYGGQPNGKQRQNIYRAPARLVGPYATSDADLPLRLAKVFYPLLRDENLLDLFSLENRLIRLMLDMRFTGVRVDIPKAEQLREKLLKQENEKQNKLDKLVSEHVDVYSNKSLAKVFDKFRIPYNLTKPKNDTPPQPSFTQGFLNTVEHPIGNLVREVRTLDKLRSTFIESYILNSHVNGRVHGQFHLLRGDDNGTRSGRLSSSTPNLQNLPSRGDLAKTIRELFIPDDGHKSWLKYDYSQIEYRFLIHYAVGPSSDDVRQKFINDPDIDYHDYALDLVAPLANWNISTPEQRKYWRRPIKNINFGLIYGMGVAALSEALKISVAEGRKLFDIYHQGVPFAKPTMDTTSNEAQQKGYITTILNRRSRFNLWEPIGYSDEQPTTFEQALKRYGKIRRAGTHKALNRRLQGSAADLMKMAMLKAYESGVFGITGIPKLTVHDELDFSNPGNCDEAFRELVHIMETAIPLRIPVRTDKEYGPNWGNLKSK